MLRILLGLRLLLLHNHYTAGFHRVVRQLGQVLAGRDLLLLLLDLGGQVGKFSTDCLLRVSCLPVVLPQAHLSVGAAIPPREGSRKFHVLSTDRAEA